MIPSKARVLYVVEAYLRHQLGAAWGTHHALQSVRELQLVDARGGATAAARATRPSMTSRPLGSALGGDAATGEALLAAVELLSPSYRRVLELRASGYTVQDLRKTMKCSASTALSILRAATEAGRMFLLVARR